MTRFYPLGPPPSYDPNKSDWSGCWWFLLLAAFLLLASLACGTMPYIAPTDTTEPIYQETAEKVTHVTAEPEQYTTTAPLNVRAFPCFGSTILFTLPPETPVQVYGIEYRCALDGSLWAMIGDGQWVNRRYIR